MRWQPALAVLALLLSLLNASQTVGGVGALFTDQHALAGNTITTGDFGGGPSTATLTAVADTYLRDGNANQANANYSAEAVLRVQQNGPRRALVLFDTAEMQSAAAGKTLTEAKLRLYVESATNWGAGRPVDVYRLTAAWLELGATWNCPDDADTSNSLPDCATQWGGGAFAAASDSVLHTNGLSGWVEWDVTADVALFLASPGANCGWLLKKQNDGPGGGSGRVDYSSREGANPPQLVLTFE